MTAQTKVGVKRSKAAKAPKVTEDGRNLEVVKEFFALSEALDVEKAMEFFADDAVYHNIPLPAVRGKRNIERTLKGMMRYASGFEVEMLNISAGGNAVLTERVDTITAGPFKVALPVMGAFEFRDGKITAWRDYFDLIQFARGMAPGFQGLVQNGFRALLEPVKG